MTGQMVIAELEAFRSILLNASAQDSEKIRLWSRSTISNALHRAGPTEELKTAARLAWDDADALAKLVTATEPGVELAARDKALRSLDMLISEIRAIRP